MKQNKKQVTKSPPFRIAFQANIFRFIQKKKNQISLFAINSKRNSLFQNRNRETQTALDNSLISNLIQQINISPKGQPYDKINNRKRRFSHKTTLSDWRTLYKGQQNQIEPLKSQTKQDKKQYVQLQKQIREASSLQNHLHSTLYSNFSKMKNKQRRQMAFSKTMSHINSQMQYTKSNFSAIKKSKSLMINPEQQLLKQRNFLKLNISKQKQLISELHMMNQRILINNDSVANDLSFQPYHKQIKLQKNIIQHQQKKKKKQASKNQPVKIGLEMQEINKVQEGNNKCLSSIFGATAFLSFSVSNNKDKNLKMDLFKSKKNKVQQTMVMQIPKQGKAQNCYRDKDKYNQTNYFSKYKPDKTRNFSLNKLIIQ